MREHLVSEQGLNEEIEEVVETSRRVIERLVI